MAKIETITNVQGHPMRILNVSYSVGTKGINNIEDVMVVKALLSYIHWDTEVMKMTGLQPTDIPSPFDGTTYGLPEIIKKVQKGLKKMDFLKDYKIKTDGNIKPASQRAVKDGIYYTIAGLNSLAARLSYRYGNKDHIATLFLNFEHLKPIENNENAYLPTGSGGIVF